MKTVNMIVISKGTIKKYKYDVNDCNTPEVVVRNQCCWFSDETVFIVKDKSIDTISVFKKINTDNAVAGYSDIVELNEKDCLNYLFDY